jgi:uroporphyrinogen III methyltransferase/synthase
MSMVLPTGMVYVIGAGPGETGLLTLRAAECLALADVVFYDQELPARLLEHVPRRAARHAVGEADVADLIVQAAQEGRKVVRLHAGSADLRGTAGLELRTLRRADVPFELIPGVGLAPPEAVRCHRTRPLSGQTVVVTRPIGQAESLAQPLEAMGARVFRWPLLQFGPAPDPAAVTQVLQHLSDFNWLVFTSVVGVESWLRELSQHGLDLRALGHLRLAAIGPKTAEALRRAHLRPDVVPATYDSEHLAEALLPRVSGQRVLLVRADRGRDLLREQLSRVAAVTQLAIYRQLEGEPPDSELLHELREGHVEWITLTSSQMARIFAAAIDPQVRAHLGGPTQLICISPHTAATCAALGLPVGGVAQIYSAEGIVQLIHELAERTGKAAKPSAPA